MPLTHHLLRWPLETVVPENLINLTYIKSVCCFFSVFATKEEMR